VQLCVWHESLIRRETRVISSRSSLCLISGPPSYVGDTCAEVQARGELARQLGVDRLILIPYRYQPEQVEIIQDWDVVGMRATGSFDLKVTNVEVPREWTFIRGGSPTVDEPLFRYPSLGYASQVLAVVGAGVARAALDFAIETGAGRSGVTGAPRLADRAYYRTGVAEAEAMRAMSEADLRAMTRMIEGDAAVAAWRTGHPRV
jgi:alkylation response protein AidB-like acyl-CoA dehydrogenase